MKKLALAMAMTATLLLSGCTIFYDVEYVSETQEVREYGMLGYGNTELAPNKGPYGLIPFMHEVRTKAGQPVLPPPPEPVPAGQ
ncbi:MAG: hypothetical protein ABFD69_06815 [Candidatus Sumerlaeia bacterium]